MQLFTDIKKSLKRCSVLSKNQTLFNLFKVYLSFAQYGFYISTENLSNALTCLITNVVCGVSEFYLEKHLVVRSTLPLRFQQARRIHLSSFLY